MKLFEDRTYTGPLAEFINGCKPHRIEAIYNTEYRYIKEIIWDNAANRKFGSSREGYKAWSKTQTGLATYSGEINLRIIKDRKTGKPLSYFTETKMTSNDSFLEMKRQYELAKVKFYELLDVKDIKNFDYWLDNNHGGFGFSRGGGANETISSIESLETILNEYNDDEEYKAFIDKIKG